MLYFRLPMNLKTYVLGLIINVIDWIFLEIENILTRQEIPLDLNVQHIQRLKLLN